MKFDWQHYKRRLDRLSEELGAWKAVAAVLAAVMLLWALHPTRQLDTGDTPEGVVEITYMGPGGPISGAMEDVVREFERLSREANAADPSKPVYRVVSGQNAARDQVADPTRFLVSVAGGMAPDVIWFDRYAVAEWAARGAFEPLDGFIERDLAEGRTDAVRPERWYKCCWDEARWAGKIYGIPASVDDRALIYNRDLLVRAGLVDEAGRAKPPADWDELKSYAVRLSEWADKEKNVISGAEMLRRAGLTDAGGAPRMPRDWGEVQRLKAEARKHTLRVAGFAPNYGNSWLYIYGWMAGAEFMSADGLTCRLNSPEVVRALAYMREVYDCLGGYDRVMEFQAGFQGGELDPFIQGKVVMKIDGSWQMASLAAYGRDVDFGVAGPPLPKDELARGRKTVSWNGGWAYAIPSVIPDENKSAAWKFIRFLASDRAFWIWRENERAIQEATGRLYIPGQAPVKDLNDAIFEKYVYSNELLPEKYREGCRVFNALLPYARYRPVTPVGQRLWKAHVDGMEAGLHDDSRVDEGPEAIAKAALDAQTALVQRELERFTEEPEGGEVSLAWFFIVYPILLVLFAAALFLWDTNPRFRARVARLLRLGGNAGSVIEGARGGYFRKQWWGGVLCALPWIVGFVVFAGGPMIFSIIMSFCDYDILTPPRFVGFGNYKVMFAEDGLFYTALWNTLYMVIGVPLGMVASLSIALLLNMKIRGVSVWRTFFYLPAIVPMVAASVMWVVIFNPQGGLINQFLDMIGLEGPGWLQNAHWSKPSLILMGLWSAGGGMLIWLAGLKGIPEQLYEAASVDGASTWQQFRHVTIPQLTPYIFFNLIMGFIGTFQIFAAAFIMTSGGPENSTLFFVYHLFNNAFRYGKMGYASAMAWILFLIVMALTIVQLKLSKRWVYYESD
jgi:multiple sugar transport system permease protein